MHSFGNSRRLSAVRDSGSEIGALDPAPTMPEAHHFIYCGGNGPCRPKASEGWLNLAPLPLFLLALFRGGDLEP
jgi:hypothetical protein